jgi:hypothetical protein
LERRSGRRGRPHGVERITPTVTSNSNELEEDDKYQLYTVFNIIELLMKENIESGSIVIPHLLECFTKNIFGKICPSNYHI